jgi:hypothetical protein
MHPDNSLHPLNQTLRFYFVTPNSFVYVSTGGLESSVNNGSEISLMHSNKKLFLSVASFVLLLLALSFPAMAELGGDVKSVATDQARFRGSLRVTHASNYDVHQIQSPSGVAIKEYVAPTGKVFAVGWQGQHIPNLRQLLGSYFEQYSRALASSRRGHGPLFVQLPGLVVQSSGHTRAFVGRAYVPQMFPEGVKVEAIK